MVTAPGSALGAQVHEATAVFVGTPVDVDPYEGEGPFDRLVIFAVSGADDQRIAVAVDGQHECAPAWAAFENLGVETVVQAAVVGTELGASQCTVPGEPDDAATAPDDEPATEDTVATGAPEPSPPSSTADDVSVDELRSASATASAEAAEERPLAEDDVDVVELAVGQDRSADDGSSSPWIPIAVVGGIVALTIFIWDFRRPKWAKHPAPRHARSPRH